MNKKILNIGLLIAMGMNVATANAASSGTITFNGSITGSTCEVAVNGKTADATVTLPTVPAEALSATGETTGKTGFFMSLTNCAAPVPGASQVAAFFQAGASVDNTTGRLKQLAPGDTAATNVSLQLSDGVSDAPIFVGNSSQIQNNHFEAITGEQGEEVRLAYEVEYYAEDAVTAGLVTSNVVYNLQYK
ncbi:fimbrial protein [Aeromonas jandaei]|uniref:fimbrial protein n=1 Tax=Aeromonas jandaei TaxID=650 RepID=UPI003EC57039